MKLDLAMPGILSSNSPFTIILTTSPSADVIVTLENPSGAHDFALKWPGHDEAAAASHTVRVGPPVVAKVSDWGTAASGEEIKVTATVTGQPPVTKVGTVL